MGHHCSPCRPGGAHRHHSWRHRRCLLSAPPWCAWQPGAPMRPFLSVNAPWCGGKTRHYSRKPPGPALAKLIAVEGVSLSLPPTREPLNRLDPTDRSWVSLLRSRLGNTELCGTQITLTATEEFRTQENRAVGLHRDRGSSQVGVHLARLYCPRQHCHHAIAAAGWAVAAALCYLGW